METEKENKLIARFMGFNIQDEVFKASWDWMMEVVDRIEGFGYSVVVARAADLSYICKVIEIDSQQGLEKTDFQGYPKWADTRIECVFNRCLTFIEWYNKQK